MICFKIGRGIKMKGHILQLLENAEDYISGEKMSQQLGVSRTAVWKTIKQLKEEGYEIHSSTNKGYRLLHSPDRVTPEEIQKYILTSYIGKRLIYEEEMDSTNVQAKKIAREGAEEGTVVLTEQQFKGKGRMGRKWDSPKGTGIWLSCILRPSIPPSEVSFITLLAGLAVCKAIEIETRLLPKIKWPNDVVLGGKKVCGILTEMNGEMEQVYHVVVGIGINVNTKDFPIELHSLATSLYLESGEKYSRKKLVGQIFTQLEKYYESFKEEEGRKRILEEYKKCCATLGQEVRVLGSQEEFTGKALDLLPTGELIVQKNTGEMKTVRSGEVSVRGVYGYC